LGTGPIFPELPGADTLPSNFAVVDRDAFVEQAPLPIRSMEPTYSGSIADVLPREWAWRRWPRIAGNGRCQVAIRSNLRGRNHPESFKENRNPPDWLIFRKYKRRRLLVGPAGGPAHWRRLRCNDKRRLPHRPRRPLRPQRRARSMTAERLSLLPSNLRTAAGLASHDKALSSFTFGRSRPPAAAFGSGGRASGSGLEESRSAPSGCERPFACDAPLGIWRILRRASRIWKPKLNLVADDARRVGRQRERPRAVPFRISKTLTRRIEPISGGIGSLHLPRGTTVQRLSSDEGLVQVNGKPTRRVNGPRPAT